jgi:hypothetical protein
MDKLDKLKELKTLFDNGTINENEFSILKNEILNSNITNEISRNKEIDLTSIKIIHFAKTEITDYFIIENPKDKFSQNQTYWLKENISLESSNPNNYLSVVSKSYLNAKIELTLGMDINIEGFNIIFNIDIGIYQNDERINDKIKLIAPLLSNAKINFILDGQSDILNLDRCSSYRLSPYSGCAENAQIITNSKKIIERLASAKKIEYKVTYSANNSDDQTTSKGEFNAKDIIKIQAFYNSFFDANFEINKILSQIKHN